MPEGPEIRLAADLIAKAIEGKKIQSARFFIDHLADYDRIFTGVTVREVQTRCKALLTHFENGYTIYSHNQLYGRWYVLPSDKKPKTSRSLRLALRYLSITGSFDCLLLNFSCLAFFIFFLF